MNENRISIKCSLNFNFSLIKICIIIFSYENWNFFKEKEVKPVHNKNFTLNKSFITHFKNGNRKKIKR